MVPATGSSGRWRPAPIRGVPGDLAVSAGPGAAAERVRRCGRPDVRACLAPAVRARLFAR